MYNLKLQPQAITNSIGNMVRAILAAFIQQWKTTATSIFSLSFLITAVPTVSVLAWIAIKSNSADVFTYLLVGAPIMAIWNGVVFRVGWSLSSELSGRTLEFAMISRTPMMLVLFGKTLAQLAYGIPTGIIALLTMFIVTRQLPAVANIPCLIVSLLFVIIGLAVTSLLFSPLMVLVGGRAGFFNAIMPLGVLVSGFMFPVDQLPIGLEVFARLLPTSWAMSGVWQSIRSIDTLWSIFAAWGACLLTSALLLIITYIMFKAVEKRIRITGALGIH